LFPVFLFPVSNAYADPARTNESSSAAASNTFDIVEIRVLGNTVLPTMQIESALYPHLGIGKTLDDVQATRTALEKIYHDAGYSTVYVDIPEQSVDEGIVRLKVTEGRIGQVRVTGARYFRNRKIVSDIPSIEQGRVPFFPDVQRELGAANNVSRDRLVTPIVKAGREPGKVDVELKVKDELPVHGSVEVNNRYTADTSKTRASINLSYDNLWQRFHSLSVQYQTAPEAPREARVIAATYIAPLPNRNLLAVYAVDTNSDVATVGTLSVLGKGRIYGTRYIERLPDGASYSHSLTLGGDYKDFSENVRVSTDTGLQTPIAYANWSVVYGGTWRAEKTAASFNIGANFGIRGLANDPAEFENKRFKARPNYFYLRGDTNVERQSFFGTRIGLRVAAQYTTEPLISNEQFSIGGADSIRGYLESEALGDYGISSSLELRSPSLKSWLPHTDSFYLLAFADAGIVNIVDSLPAQDSQMRLSSYGAGLRFDGFGGVQANLDWAVPLKSTGRTPAHESRIHFLVRYGF